METILMYLDNMFLNFPQIPEVLRARKNLEEMMEDQYNELIANGKMENEAIGIVISEFGNIKELADELGIRNTEQTPYGVLGIKTEKNGDPSGINSETKIAGINSEIKVDGVPGRKSEKYEDLLEIHSETGTNAASGIGSKHDEKSSGIHPGMQADYLSGIESEKGATGIDPEMETNGVTRIKLEKNKDTDSGYDRGDGNSPYSSADDRKEEYRELSVEEADAYLSDVRISAKRIAFGVFFCICSPIAIMLLSGIHDAGFGSGTNGYEAVGISILLVMVACAVGLFISAGMRMEKYEFLKKECFFLDQEFRQSVQYLRESKKAIFTMKIILGVVMCIVSVIPLLFTEVFFGQNDLADIIAVVILLVIVGLAVILFITSGMESESYKIILQEEEFSIRSKKRSKIDQAIAAFFWTCITIIYLVWSFRSGDWWITWIIWPLSELLYHAVSVAVRNAIGE